MTEIQKPQPLTRWTIPGFVGTFVGTTLLFGLVAFFIGVGFAILGPAIGHDSWNNWPPTFGRAGLFLGGGLVVWLAFSDMREADRAKVAQRAVSREAAATLERQRVEAAQTAAIQVRQQDEYEQRRAVEAAEQRRTDLTAQVLAQASNAVDRFAALPQHLNRGQEWRNRAATAFDDGAFSPFWSAMESAYAEIGAYRDVADKITDLRRHHTALLRSLAAVGGGLLPVATFPVDLDVERVRVTLDRATRDLGDLTYRAQREPTFAIIWEQRRTTESIVSGFKNLEAAVAGMRYSVESSLDSLEESLREGSMKTNALLHDVSKTMTETQREALPALKNMSHRSDQIREELYRQNWGDYPLGG